MTILFLPPHPVVDDFTVDLQNEVIGSTISGITFTQNIISNDICLLQKFKIQEAWWYVSDRGLIGYGEGLSDIQALSIYLTLPESTG